MVENVVSRIHLVKFEHVVVVPYIQDLRRLNSLHQMSGSNKNRTIQLLIRGALNRWKPAPLEPVECTIQQSFRTKFSFYFQKRSFLLVYSNFWTFLSILPIRSIRWLKWLAYPTSKLSKAYTKLQSSGAFRVFIKASNIWKNNLTKDSNCGNELFLPSAPRQVIDVTKPKNPATSPLSRNFRKCFTKVRSNLTR